MELEPTIAAPTEIISDTVETPVPSATDETVPAGTTPAGTESEDEAEVNAAASEGKIDAKKVNEIVQRRVEKVRTKTREDAEKQAREEVEFWQEKAKAVRVAPVVATLPPKPAMVDFASNPADYEKKLEEWTTLKAQVEQYHGGIQTAYNQRAVEFSKDKPDYQKSVNFFNSVTVQSALMSGILESDQGPALTYYLSKNFKEFDRINKLQSPMTIAKELGKLELKLTGQTVEPAPVSTKKVVPSPTKPVTGAAPVETTGLSLAKKDPAAFIAERKKFHRQGAWGR